MLELKEKIEKEMIEYIDRYEERFLSCIRTLSNCLLSDETLMQFNNPKLMPITRKLIELLEFFKSDFKEIFSFVPQDKID